MFSKINKMSVKAYSGCNLMCVFCHQLTNDKKSDMFFNDFSNLEKLLYEINFDDIVDVTITGGEITLQPEWFENVARVFKKVEKRKEVRFDLCAVTNGTNMNVIYDWCDRQLIVPRKTAISWDGIHSASKSRLTGGKYNDDFFLDVVKDLGKTRYHKDICLTPAITPNTINELYDSMKFCFEHNVYNFGYYFIHEANYSDPIFVKEFKNQLIKMAELYLEYINKGLDVSYYNWQVIYTKRKMPKNFFLCSKLGNNLHIDIDGKIYPCIYFGDHKTFSIGDLQNGLNYDEMKRFSDEFLTFPKCNFKHCENLQCSECPASCYVHKKSLSERFCNQCHILPIETEIYDEYAPKIDNLYLHPNLYIPKDEYLRGMKIYDQLKDNSLAVYHDDTGIKSPSFNKVRTW